MKNGLSLFALSFVWGLSPEPPSDSPEPSEPIGGPNPRPEDSSVPVPTSVSSADVDLPEFDGSAWLFVGSEPSVVVALFSSSTSPVVAFLSSSGSPVVSLLLTVMLRMSTKLFVWTGKITGGGLSGFGNGLW